MRFSIRDLLWLTVVAAIGALLIIDRMAIKKERAELHEQVAAEREKIVAEKVTFENDVAKLAELNHTLNARQRNLGQEVADRARAIVRVVQPASEVELERAKRESAALGAPEPQPLPPGFGEQPQEE